MKEKIIRYKKNTADNSKWEKKVFDGLSCDELFLIESRRDLSGDSEKVVKRSILLKGCREN